LNFITGFITALENQHDENVVTPQAGVYVETGSYEPGIEANNLPARRFTFLKEELDQYSQAMEMEIKSLKAKMGVLRVLYP